MVSFSSTLSADGSASGKGESSASVDDDLADDNREEEEKEDEAEGGGRIGEFWERQRD